MPPEKQNPNPDHSRAVVIPGDGPARPNARSVSDSYRPKAEANLSDLPPKIQLLFAKKVCESSDILSLRQKRFFLGSMCCAQKLFSQSTIIVVITLFKILAEKYNIKENVR